jgi:integrase
MRESNKLSPKHIAKLNEVGRYADGGGLYLQVSPGPTKSWIFRYQIDGRARHMGIGSVDDFTLAEARDRARRARQQVTDGIDPIDARQAARDARRLAAASRVTFKECGEGYIAAFAPTWRNAAHRAQWKSTLANYAYPLIGNLAVSDINRSHVLKVIEPIWQDKWDTANRIRGRIEQILDWAAVRGYRQGDNPARWKGQLQKLLPAKNERQHHKAIPYQELPAFIAELRTRDYISSRALEFTILTASRTNEAIGARWDEIDIESKAWTIPGNRMKSGRPHRVPLSDRALQILYSTPRLDDGLFVFPGRAGQPLSNMAMLELLRGTIGNGFTVHGFRSTFKDWAREQTNFSNELSESALAHVIKDKTEAAYARGDLFDKRRKLMDEWAAYCGRGGKS